MLNNHLYCRNPWICDVYHIIGKIRGSGWQTSFINKKYLCRLFLGREAHRKYIWLTSGPQIMNNNHYTQSNLLIDNVPLSAHINNYSIKLIIPLKKTGQLPALANVSNKKDKY